MYLEQIEKDNIWLLTQHLIIASFTLAFYFLYPGIKFLKPPNIVFTHISTKHTQIAD